MSKEGEVQGERAKEEEEGSAKKREREEGTSGQCGCIAFSFHGGIEAKKARRYRGYAMWHRDDRAHYNVPPCRGTPVCTRRKYGCAYYWETHGAANSRHTWTSLDVGEKCTMSPAILMMLIEYFHGVTCTTVNSRLLSSVVRYRDQFRVSASAVVVIGYASPSLYRSLKVSARSGPVSYCDRCFSCQEKVHSEETESTSVYRHMSIRECVAIVRRHL